ncbi:MAG: RluA family pseudouridine synthase [candidate division Zixibacteria bacterium]|nr:RluA family pseudouridine synthase [candidate division Zixibacteria bacterium]
MSRKISKKIDAEVAGQRLDIYCKHLLEDITRSRIKNLIDDEKILINGQPVKAGYTLKEGDILDLTIPPPAESEIKPENIPLDIVYQDRDMLVVDKPAGMVVHPAAGNYTGTLVNALLYHIKDLSGIGGEVKPGIVHRLDKDTSGLLLVAKTDQAHLRLSEQIRNRIVKRLYKTIVIGDLPQNEGDLRFPIGRSSSDRTKMTVTHKGSRDAHTQYNVIERFGRYTFAQMRLQTGRTHQIRVHLSHSGYPVLGDPDYGGREQPPGILDKRELDLWRKLMKVLERQALHAYHLTFEHPISGKSVTFESSLPDDFQEAINSIRDFYISR